MALIGYKLGNEELAAIAISEAAINTAWDKIVAFMRDAGQRRKYEQRECYEHDYVSDRKARGKTAEMRGLNRDCVRGNSLASSKWR